MKYATIDNHVNTSSEASVVETVSGVMHSSVIGSSAKESDDELETQPVTQALLVINHQLIILLFCI